MESSPSAPPRRTRPEGRPPPDRPPPLRASHGRKHSDVSDGAKSEPLVRRSTSRGTSKGRERRESMKEEGGAAAAGAWDWQTRKWVSPAVAQSQRELNPKGAGMSMHANKQGGWVSDLEGISENEVAEEQRRTQQIVARVKRDGKVLVRSRRRGYQVIDLQTRRKFTRREHFRRQMNLRRNSLDYPPRAFPLLNLEDYLKQKTPHIEEVVSPPAVGVHLSYGQDKPRMMVHQQRLDFACETPLKLSNIGYAQSRGRPQFSMRLYGSADEVDDDSDALHSERSGCGMSWHWPSSRTRNDSHVDYAGSCFPVSRRKAGRKNRVGYRYASERSVSSFDSDSETIPLMTEPEPFHEYSDDLAASSMELDTPRTDRFEDSKLRKFSRFKEDGRNGITYNNADESGQLLIRRQREDIDKHRSLSQKYRPKSLKDLIGQNMVVESLSNAILRSKIAPVYLFHGPRGTGKTSAAKILTAAVNCLSIEELRPCGLCKECMASNKGQNFDVKEVDAAANNEIQSMRLLLKHISLPPSTSRYKVFIIDDCHMLTAEAWNILLKSLEEPPAYVVFILITTDLDQIPRTAISRCQKFMFPRIKEADIILRLRKLALLEKVEIELEALQFIASRSDGSFRDAETMLDQLSLLGKRVTLPLVREMVGLIPDDKLAKLLEFALSADTVSTVNTIRELTDSGAEPLALVSQLAILITDLLAGKNRLAGFLTLKVRKEEQERLRQALRILSEAEKQLRTCSDRTTWLTAAFLQFASNDSGPLGSSSMGTSVTQSPVVFLDSSEKEAMDMGSRRPSWGGDSHSPLQLEYNQGAGGKDGEALHRRMNNHSHHFSGPFTDNRIYPCDQSPQSSSCAEERESITGTGQASPGINKLAQNNASAMSPSTMDNIWREVLHASGSNMLKQLLHREGKLVSLSVTEALAIARLEFRSAENKAMAERAKANIIDAFQQSLGCPVEVDIALSSQGESNFASRAESPSMSRLGRHSSRPSLMDQDSRFLQEQRRIRSSSSFRRSSNSFRNVAPISSSPRYRNLEHRKSKQSFELEGNSFSRKSTDTSNRDHNAMERGKQNEGTGRVSMKVSNQATDRSSSGVQLVNNSSHMNEYAEEAAGLDDPRYSVSAHGKDNDNDDDAEYNSSGSETQDDSAPSLLCWKGARVSNHKGKHHVLRRRRRTRFLLRLVPCAKEGGGQS